MGSRKPTEQKQSSTQTSAPPSWADRLFRSGSQDALNLYHTGVGGNVYGGPRVAPLSALTKQAMSGLGGVPGQYQNYMGYVMSTPTQAERNLNALTSSAMSGGEYSPFNRALQNSMNRVRDEVNSVYASAGRDGSGYHADAMDRGLTNAMADHFGQYMQNMTQANAVLGDLNKYRLGMVGNLLPAYNNAYSNALQGSSLLDDYNQRLIDADREHWLERDNSGWNRLNMLMNAARGFAGNYGQTTNKSTASLMPGNDPWKNTGTVGSMALNVAPIALGYAIGGPAGALAASMGNTDFFNNKKQK